MPKNFLNKNSALQTSPNNGQTIEDGRIQRKILHPRKLCADLSTEVVDMFLLASHPACGAAPGPGIMTRST